MHLKIYSTNILNKEGRINPNRRFIYKKYPELQKFIVDATTFLWSFNGKEITDNERLYVIHNNITSQPICVCSKPLRYVKDKHKFPEFCSVKCSMNSQQTQNKRKETCINLYGDVNPCRNKEVAAKISNTLKNKTIDERSEINKKRKTTSLLKYGVDNPSKNKEVAKKKELTCLERYGVTSPTQHLGVKEKIKQNHSKKLYGNINNKQWLIEQHHIQKLSLKTIAQELLVSSSVVSTRFRDFNIDVRSTFTSATQQEIVDWLLSLDVNLEENMKLPNNQEIDILCGNVGIELNGVIWHSDNFAGRTKHYHYNKTKEAECNNIQLIHIWDVEWLTQQDIVKSRILSALGLNDTIGARLTTIKEISFKEAVTFMEANHIQGYTASSVRIGLFNNTNLIGCMTFSKSRFNTKYEYELTRFCTKTNINVVGGAGKCLSYFKRMYNPKSIVSFKDLRWGGHNTTLYKSIGFSLSHTSSPNYWYFNYSNVHCLYHRFSYQKHKLCDKLETFNPMLSEWENMKLNKFDRIWDCGNEVWVYSHPTQG